MFAKCPCQRLALGNCLTLPLLWVTYMEPWALTLSRIPKLQSWLYQLAWNPTYLQTTWSLLEVSLLPCSFPLFLSSWVLHSSCTPGFILYTPCSWICWVCPDFASILCHQTAQDPLTFPAAGFDERVRNKFLF